MGRREREGGARGDGLRGGSLVPSPQNLPSSSQGRLPSTTLSKSPSLRAPRNDPAPPRCSV